MSPIIIPSDDSTVQGLVSRIVAAGDTSDADALSRYNTAHKRMVARALAFRKVVSLGVTVAGQGAYAVPVDLIELRELSVAGEPYGKMRHVEIAAGPAGRLRLRGPGGVFAEQRDGTGLGEVAIYPVPGTNGDAITGYGIFAAPTQGLSDVPMVDSDFWDDIVDYALALSRERDDDRQDSAAGFRQHFDAACEELRRRVARRYRGSGPAQIRVAGYNA